jgi:hypothetical protein
MTDELRIGKDLKGSGHGLIEVPSNYLPGRPEEYREMSQDARCPSRHANGALPESKSRVLPLSNPARKGGENEETEQMFSVEFRRIFPLKTNISL